MNRQNTHLKEKYSLKELCTLLSISTATGNNWIRQGKIQPTGKADGKPYFTKEAVSHILDEISRDGQRLKTRRNKRYVAGNGLYESYIPKDSPNYPVISRVLSRLGQRSELSQGEMTAVLADCARQLLDQSRQAASALQLLNYHVLIEDLLLSGGYQEADSHILKEISQERYIWEKNTDVLGMLYISLKGLGDRKAAGAYYTPTHIVKQSIENLEEYGVFTKEAAILDPCCGTGNFLLQLPEKVSLEQIHGMDIDSISVLLARINLALKFPEVSVERIKCRVIRQDFLKGELKQRYDCILGNPPWGYGFSREKVRELEKRYGCIRGKKAESYDVFTEQALNHVKTGGRVAFVLPEAILNVGSHRGIRRVILAQSDMERLTFLGEAFHKVQCPSIIMQLRRTGKTMCPKGTRVTLEEKTFQIAGKREISEERFLFHMEDEDYSILEKLSHGDKVQYLKNQANFALGVVTGDNKKYLDRHKTGKNEQVLKGTDIYKYQICPSENYLEFLPEKMQQTAPEAYYRAQRKLLYRFISDQLVFACDEEQRVSLNSANLLIPQIPGMDMRYIMAVLNSRTAQFLFQKKFRSVKVLRSHIEQIPIPQARQEQQDMLIGLAEQIACCTDAGKRLELYEEADRQIAGLFRLTGREYKRICEETGTNNLFLNH